MPEVLGNPPSPRTALFWNGTVWQWALVDAAGHVQIDVISTVMDAAAATAANQATMITALQLIDDLRNALQSVNTDALQVRGEDQLYSIESVLGFVTSGPMVGVNGYIQSAAVPLGEIWKVTNIAGINLTRATTEHDPMFIHDAVDVHLGGEVRAFGVGSPSRWTGEVWADHEDTLRVYMVGGLVGDNCRIYIAGHRMTVEV